jgi:hypothetical protein
MIEVVAEGVPEMKQPPFRNMRANKIGTNSKGIAKPESYFPWLCDVRTWKWLQVGNEIYYNVSGK